MLEQLEAELQHLVLLHRIEAASARIAQGEVAEHEAGNAAMFDDVFRGAEQDSRYAGSFELTGNQTHGLVTHRSDGRHYRNVDFFFDAAPDRFRSVDIGGLSLRVAGVDAVKTRGKGADSTLLDKLSQAVDWVVGVDIVKVRGVLVVMLLARVQLVDRGVGRQRVHVADGELVATVALAVRAHDGDIGRRHDGDPALRQRFGEQRERDVGVMGPLVWLLVPLADVIVACAIHVSNVLAHDCPLAQRSMIDRVVAVSLWAQMQPRDFDRHRSLAVRRGVDAV
jgi:hypothetical protein